MRKRCEHQWMPLGRDVYSCSKCGVIKENYTAELKQQLQVKNREIETLKQIVDAKTEVVNSIRMHERYITCEKIRDFIHSEECKVKGMEFVLLLSKLDQIEQGERR